MTEKVLYCELCPRDFRGQPHENPYRSRDLLDDHVRSEHFLPS